MVPGDFMANLILRFMIKKFKEIASGWANYIFPNPEVEKIAIERAKICSKCPNAIHGTWLEGYVKDKSIKEVSGLKCNICNCPLSAKCRSKDSECPEDKWPAITKNT